MSSGVFAIIGVVLGTVLTYVVQNRMASRAEDFVQRQRLRDERLDAYSAFAAGVMDARRAQINRWYQRRESQRGSQLYESAKADSYHARTAARRDEYRVQLVAKDESTRVRAREVVESLGAIHKADTRADMEDRADVTRELIDRFVTEASAQLAPDLAQTGRA